MPRSRFSDPCLMVRCPACGVPPGCACRVIDSSSPRVLGVKWGEIREPHDSRLRTYSDWKIRTFGPSVVSYQPPCDHVTEETT